MDRQSNFTAILCAMAAALSGAAKAGHGDSPAAASGSAAVAETLGWGTVAAALREDIAESAPPGWAGVVASLDGLQQEQVPSGWSRVVAAIEPDDEEDTHALFRPPNRKRRRRPQGVLVEILQEAGVSVQSKSEQLAAARACRQADPRRLSAPLPAERGTVHLLIDSGAEVHVVAPPRFAKHIPLETPARDSGSKLSTAAS